MKKVWVNGCFDILHRGHMELFKHAKSKGDYLIVGIDTDRRVRESKGPERPINNQEDRKFFLECIRFVDEVIVFDNEVELKKLIKQNEIDCMMVGSDWRNKKVIGSECSKELLFFNRIGNYSTTKILEKK